MEYIPFIVLSMCIIGAIFRGAVCILAVRWMTRRDQRYGHLGYRDQPAIPWFVKLYWKQL